MCRDTELSTSAQLGNYKAWIYLTRHWLIYTSTQTSCPQQLARLPRWLKEEDLKARAQHARCSARALQVSALVLQRQDNWRSALSVILTSEERPVIGTGLTRSKQIGLPRKELIMCGLRCRGNIDNVSLLNPSNRLRIIHSCGRISGSCGRPYCRISNSAWNKLRCWVTSIYSTLNWRLPFTHCAVSSPSGKRCPQGMIHMVMGFRVPSELMSMLLKIDFNSGSLRPWLSAICENSA